MQHTQRRLEAKSGRGELTITMVNRGEHVIYVSDSKEF